MINRLIRLSLALFSISFATALHAQQEVDLVNSGEILLEGDLYYSLGHYQKAINLYVKVGRNDTNYAAVTRDLAYTYSENKDDSLCLITARRGLTLNSEFQADFYNLIGISLKEMAKYDTAIKAFDEGIRLYPYKYLLHYQKGMTYYKMKKYPEAQLCFEKACELNPYHSNSHFQLGKTCAEQGRVVPAILSFEYFLMLENNTERAQKVVSNLEDLYTGDYQSDPDFQLSAKEAGDECFGSIKDLIDSKTAESPNYKNKTIINLKMVKHFQAILEKLQYEPNTGNWWMENYVPFFVELQKKNFLAPFESHTLFAVSGDNPSVRKSIKKNKKKITEFAKWAAKYIDDNVKHPARNDFSKDAKVKVTYYDNHIIAGAGEVDALGNENGGWEYFYQRTGRLLSKGNFVKGKRDGDWIWYYSDGTLREKSHFTNGERDGASEEYYSNGVISFRSKYVNGLLDGDYTAYGLHGGIIEVAHMKLGKLDGKATAYFEDGTIKAELNYTAGKLNGDLILNTIDGKLYKKSTYLNDLRNGKSVEYYTTGVLKSEGDYKKDEPFGPWKNYWDNGKVYREGVYKDGGLRNGDWKEYYRDGTLSIETKYTSGKANGISKYYDTDGKIYAEKQYAMNALKHETFYSKDGKVIAEYNITAGDDVIEYYPSGIRAAKGSYFLGERDGDWKVYSDNGGWLYAKEHYYNGYLSGTRTEYFENGEESSTLDFHYGERDGYLKSFYPNGTIESEGWFVNGDMQGDWFQYNQRGLVASHRYYLDGEMRGYQEYFDEKGKKDEEDFIRESNVWTRSRYDSTGTVIYKYESDNGTGTYDFKYSNDQTQVKQEYKNGVLNGVTNRFELNGTKTVETTFKNGDQHGKRIEYFEASGKISMESNYAYNERHGLTTAYFENGNKRYEENYYNGDLDGVQKYYHENGTLMKEGTWEMGSVNGELKLYADDGSLIFVRYYKNGNILGYSYMDKDGKILPMIPLEDASGKFTCNFQNGNKSIEGEYVNGRFNGNVIEYFSDGKVSEDENYKYGNYEGVQKYYYHNGTLKKQLNYVGDELDGTSSYFSENGKPEHTEFYVLGDSFGTWIYYNEAGAETKRTVYYDDRALTEFMPMPVLDTAPKPKPTSKPKPKTN